MSTTQTPSGEFLDDVNRRIELVYFNAREGEPCDKHKGCLNHIKQPCEGCGRRADRSRDFTRKLDFAFELLAHLNADRFLFGLRGGLYNRWEVDILRGPRERVCIRSDQGLAQTICIAALAIRQESAGLKGGEASNELYYRVY